MYKVVIVDDEPSIRVGLQTLIDWERYGFIIVSDAMNGREALAKHREYAPDLIIIDIRMPVMDGLQVIEEIRKTDTLCHFLILSGYADFEYAKRAISGNVDGYILKPVDEAEIIAELERIYAKLQQQAEFANISIQAEAKRREDIIQALIVEQTGELDKLLPEIELLLGPASGVYQVLLLDIQHSQAPGPSAYSSVHQALSDIYEDSDRGIIFSANPYIGVCLKETMTDDRNRERLYSELTSIQEKGLPFHAALGKVVRQITDIHHSFSEAKHVLKNTFLFDNEQFIHDYGSALHGNLRDESMNQDTLLDINALAEPIYYAIDIGKKERMEQELDRAGKEILAYDTSENAIKTAFAQLISSVLHKLASMNNQTYTIVQDYRSVIAEIYEQPNYEAMKQRISKQLSELTSLISSSSNEPVIKQIVDFIERHYYENLKLETLADTFNYTSGYLGKLFKQYTGAHFHTYLDQVRIQKAIELLGQGLKVHQVALRVGYANVDYFHSKFKKYVGESPSAYKGK